MAFGARILAHSISPDGVPLVSFEVTHPRYVLAEVNTHRILSRNSASSRAIPVTTMLRRLIDDPYTPVYWGSNKKGMQAGAELNSASQRRCLERWINARDDAMRHAQALREEGLHKQDANRLLEPFMWHTAILTATEWDNFFHLRNHPDAHPAFQTFAAMMQEELERSVPTLLDHGQWHMPLIFDKDREAAPALTRKLYPEHFEINPDSAVMRLLVKVSIGRCARVSYLTHDGKRDLEADLDLTENKLTARGHMSPLEHAARPISDEDFSHDGLPLMVHHKYLRDPQPTPFNSKTWCGNFRGWVQYRKTIPGEFDMLGYLQEQQP